MIERVSNFAEIEEHVKKSGLNFRDALTGYYKTLGEKLGFTVRVNSSVIKYGVNLGKLDVVWVEPNIVFCCEFGNTEEMLKTLWKMTEVNPEHAVLIVSSGSMCRPDNAKKIVENSALLKNFKQKFIILDISDKKVVYPN